VAALLDELADVELAPIVLAAALPKVPNALFNAEAPNTLGLVGVLKALVEAVLRASGGFASTATAEDLFVSVHCDHPASVHIMFRATIRSKGTRRTAHCKRGQE
jgi:hypothetical protein